MASVEIPLHADPQDYEPKPVFGKFTYRGALTALALVVVEAPLVYLLFRTEANVPTELVGLMAVLPAVPVAFVGLVKRHELYFEQWFPAMRQEGATPTELRSELPTMVLHNMPAMAPPTRAQRRQARADRRESKRARKAEAAEDAELAAEFVGRFGREVAAPEGRRRPWQRG